MLCVVIFEMRLRFRVDSHELSPRIEEPPDSSTIRRTVCLAKPPVPSTFKGPLSEPSDPFDALTAGAWQSPEPGAQEGWGAGLVARGGRGKAEEGEAHYSGMAVVKATDRGWNLSCSQVSQRCLLI